MRRLLFLIVTLVSLMACRASSAQTTYASSDKKHSSLDERPIEDALRKIRCPPQDFLKEATLRYYRPSELITEYSGVQGVIVRKLQSQYKKYCNEYIQEKYSNSNITPNELDRAYIKLSFLWQDVTTGKNCERSWRDYLEPDRGGALPPETHKVGETQEILCFYGLSVSNDGKVSGSGIRFLFDAVRPRDSENAIPAIHTLRPIGGIQTETIDSGRFFDVYIKPSINIRGTIIPEEVISAVALDLKIKIWARDREVPILTISMSVEYNPSPRDYCAILIVSVGVW